MAEGKKDAPSSDGLWQRVVVKLNSMGPHEEDGILGDFTTTPRTIVIALLTIGIGVLSAFAALLLL